MNSPGLGYDRKRGGTQKKMESPARPVSGCFLHRLVAGILFHIPIASGLSTTVVPQEKKGVNTLKTRTRGSESRTQESGKSIAFISVSVRGEHVEP